MLDSTIESFSNQENSTSQNSESQCALVSKLSSLPLKCVLYTHLNLSASNLESCESLSILERLKVLNISNNHIKVLPDVCKSMRTLTYVDVSRNCLSKFPEWILQLENVKTIKLGNNPLSKNFQSHLIRADWKKVEVCCIENLNLNSIPECVLTSRYLRHFEFGSTQKNSLSETNYLWTIPDSLPLSLTDLNLSCIKLSSLDHDWRAHTKLKKLYVEGNDFAWIPDELLLLSGLEEINLSSCGMFLLPKNMESLIGLRELNLAFNQLTTLPKSLELLIHLQHLDLYGNKLDTVLCDFQLLKCLEGCDLWLNCIDPNQYLPDHERLCECLRKKFDFKDRSCIQEIAEEEVEANWRTSHYSDENTCSDQDEEVDSGLDTVPADLADVSNVHETTGNSIFYEEPWEDPFEFSFSPPSSDSTADNKQVDCYCPAVSHATSQVSAPHEFPIVNGQFDDDE